MLANLLLQLKTVILPELLATLQMTAITSVLTVCLSIGLGLLLAVTAVGGLAPQAVIYKPLSFAVNVIRSFPVLILIVAMIPLTRLLIGTAIGVKAACLPLTVAATAFLSRMLEVNFQGIDPRLIEAAKALGLSNGQIVRRVILKEAVPSIVQTVTLGVISVLSATTVAGVVGAGGLGAIAVSYGYQSFNSTVLVSTVVLMVLLVQLIQMIGNRIYRKVK